MHTIDLAYVGHGIHEELVAYVADQEGYYEDEGVHVAIRDGVQLADGAAAPRRDDRPWPVAVVAADRRHRLDRCSASTPIVRCSGFSAAPT